MIWYFDSYRMYDIKLYQMRAIQPQWNKYTSKGKKSRQKYKANISQEKNWKFKISTISKTS